jgi:hypothetical protein
MFVFYRGSRSKGLSAVLAVLLLLIFAGCNGDSEARATAGSVDSIIQPDVPVEAPVDIMPTYTPVGTVTPPVTLTQSGTVEPTAGEGDFLSIDEILSEIDNDVCQNAYQTQLELEALIAEGVDVGELETAVEELMAELENCPTPTPNP